MTQKCRKIEISPEAHKVAKIKSAINDTTIKDYVSDLIIKDGHDGMTVPFSKSSWDFPSTNNDSTDQSKKGKGLLETIDLIRNSLYPNPRLAKTSQDIATVLGLDLQEASTNLESLFAKGEINRRKKGNGFEYWKPKKASAITMKVYDIMPKDPAKAQTVDEITEILPGIIKSKIQTSLYWLLEEGRVNRRLRKDKNDRRKDSWEYWKLGSSSHHTLQKRNIDIDTLLQNIPQEGKDQPISVPELATRVSLPSSTVRSALKRLSHEGKVKNITSMADGRIKERYCRTRLG